MKTLSRFPRKAKEPSQKTLEPCPTAARANLLPNQIKSDASLNQKSRSTKIKAKKSKIRFFRRLIKGERCCFPANLKPGLPANPKPGAQPWQHPHRKGRIKNQKRTTTRSGEANGFNHERFGSRSPSSRHAQVRLRREPSVSRRQFLSLAGKKIDAPRTWSTCESKQTLSGLYERRPQGPFRLLEAHCALGWYLKVGKTSRRVSLLTMTCPDRLKHLASAFNNGNSNELDPNKDEETEICSAPSHKNRPLRCDNNWDLCTAYQKCGALFARWRSQPQWKTKQERETSQTTRDNPEKEKSKKNKRRMQLKIYKHTRQHSKTNTTEHTGTENNCGKKIIESNHICMKEERKNTCMNQSTPMYNKSMLKAGKLVSVNNKAMWTCLHKQCFRDLMNSDPSYIQKGNED